MNTKDLQKAICHSRVKGAQFHRGTFNDCIICPNENMTRSPFLVKSNRSTDILDVVHTDLCGLMKVDSIGGAKYFLQFIDDYSKWGQVYILKRKSDVFQALRDFVAMIENQTGKRIKSIQSDNGREFVNATTDNFLKDHGIIIRLTVLYSPQQNGVVERRNRSLVEMARCLLL